MSRATPYLSKPTSEWNNLFEDLSNSRFFLLSRNGPTVFRVKDEEEKIFKVTLGSPHSCTCSFSLTPTIINDNNSTNSGDSSTGNSSAPSSASSVRNFHQFCVHKLYCILKVLRINKEHPLAFQSSYTDSELDQVLSGKCSTVSRTREIEATQRREQVLAIRAARQQRNNPSVSKTVEILKESNNFVPRQPLQEPLENEDPNEINICPICQDSMNSEQPLSWCRRGCGNNVHASCMQHFSNHKSNNNQETTCPLCRESWDLVLLKLDATSNSPTSIANEKSALKNVSLMKVKCMNCSCYPRRLFYRCLECSQKKYNNFVDYCSECYPRIGEFHSDHHFITSDVSITNPNEIIWLPCRNPRSNFSHISSSHHGLGTNDEINSNLNSLLNLQSREITTNDYNLLLMLDENNQRNNSQNPYQVSSTDLISHLMQSLPIITCQEITKNPLKFTNCWCKTSETQASPHGSLNENYYHLPCSHIVHIKCLKSELDLFQFEDYNKLLLNYSCHYTNCSKKIFFSLKRIKNNKKKTIKTENDNKSSIPNSLLTSTNNLLPLTAGIRISSLNSSNSLSNNPNNLIRNNSADFIGIVGDTIISSNPSSTSANKNFLPRVIVNKRPPMNLKKQKDFRSSVSSPATLTSLDGLLSSTVIHGGPIQTQAQIQGGFQDQNQAQYLDLTVNQDVNSTQELTFSVQQEIINDYNDNLDLPSSSNLKKSKQKLLPLGKLRSNIQTQNFSSSGNLLIVSNQANNNANIINSTINNSLSNSVPQSTSSFFKLPTSISRNIEKIDTTSELNSPVLEILDIRGNNLTQTNKKDRNNFPPSSTRPSIHRNKNFKERKEKECENRNDSLSLSIQSIGIS